MRKDAGKPHVDTWAGLYKSGWQKVACVEAFSHPAKFARGLIQYLYQHAIKEGFLVPGNTVLDVFAGTALGAYDAMTHGLHFVGVELEQPFHDIGSGCDCTGISKADWVRFYGRWPRMRYAEDRYWCPQCLREAGEIQRSSDMFTMSASYVRDVHTKDNKPSFATRHTNHPSGQIPTTRPHRYEGNLGLWARKGYTGARLIRGDSRELGAVLAHTDCVVSSPPYVNNTIRGGETARIPIGRSPGRLRQQRLPTPEDTGYGQHPAQLGNLPPGSVADAIVSSPPYAEGGLRTGGLDHPIQHTRKDGSSLRMGQSASTLYGQHPAQLGNLPPGSVADAILSSPPYANGCAHTGGADPQPQHIQGGPLPYVAYGQDAAQLGNLPPGSVADAIVSSPPYADTPCRTFPTSIGSRGEGRMTEAWQQHHRTAVVSAGYGTNPGQLAAMPTGAVAAVVSSPPHGGTTPVDGRAITDAKTHTRPLGLMSDLKHGYGDSPGQLAALPTGEVADAIVSSPPWEKQEAMKGAQKFKDPAAFAAYMSQHNKGHSATPEAYLRDLERQAAHTYGVSPGQIGNTQGNTFWSAARTILEQTYAVLRPGGVAIWVVKSYCRDSQIVDFPGQWKALCEHVGFQTLHEHHALLVEHHGTQRQLFGEADTEHQTARKSFFRRIYENAHPENAINFEVIFCMRKPGFCV